MNARCFQFFGLVVVIAVDSCCLISMCAIPCVACLIFSRQPTGPSYGAQHPKHFAEKSCSAQLVWTQHAYNGEFRCNVCGDDGKFPAYHCHCGFDAHPSCVSALPPTPGTVQVANGLTQEDKQEEIVLGSTLLTEKQRYILIATRMHFFTLLFCLSVSVLAELP